MTTEKQTQRELTFEELKEIVADIDMSVGGVVWHPFVGESGGEFYLQLRYVERDIETKDPKDQHTRKWKLSKFSTKSEVVQTALKAALTSSEHMVREHFLYKGERVFSPHFDIEDLVELAKKGKRDIRIPKA